MHHVLPQILFPFLSALPSILASPAVNLPRQSTCHVFREVDGREQILWLTMTNADGATLPPTSKYPSQAGDATLINQAMPYQMTAEFNLATSFDPEWSVTFTYGAWGPVTVPLVSKGPLSLDVQIWTDAVPFPY